MTTRVESFYCNAITLWGGDFISVSFKIHRVGWIQSCCFNLLPTDVPVQCLIRDYGLFVILCGQFSFDISHLLSPSQRRCSMDIHVFLVAMIPWKVCFKFLDLERFLDHPHIGIPKFTSYLFGRINSGQRLSCQTNDPLILFMILSNVGLL